MSFRSWSKQIKLLGYFLIVKIFKSKYKLSYSRRDSLSSQFVSFPWAEPQNSSLLKGTNVMWLYGRCLIVSFILYVPGINSKLISKKVSRSATQLKVPHNDFQIQVLGIKFCLLRPFDNSHTYYRKCNWLQITPQNACIM